MTEYAPQAIEDMFDRIKAGIPSAIMAGIVGDSAHTYGYHRCRDVAAPDYSTELPPDKKGDSEAACALDLSWSKASDQYTVSQRLLDAKNDSRMTPIREFYGSADGGQTVCGWDYYGGYPVTSDDSHLWHVHLSILRQYSNDTAALAKVADVITGGSTQEVDDMPKQYKWSGVKVATVKAGDWHTLSWSTYDDPKSSGTSAVIGGSYYVATLDVSVEKLSPDANLNLRFQTVDSDSLESESVSATTEVRGTTGGTGASLTRAAYVPKGQNLRAMVSATADAKITAASWSVLFWPA